MDDSLKVTKKDFLRFRNKLVDYQNRAAEESRSFEYHSEISKQYVIPYTVAVSRAKTLNDIIHAIDDVFDI